MKNLLLLSLLLFLMACSSQSEHATTSTATTSESSATVSKPNPAKANVTVVGKLTDAPKNFDLQLLHVGYNNSQTELARTKVADDGTFTFSIPDVKGVYSLKAGNQQLLFLLNGTESKVNIETSIDGMKQWGAKVTGSADNSRYFEIMQSIIRNKLPYDQLKKQLLKEENPLLASLVALQVLKDPSFADTHEAIYRAMKEDPTISKEEYTKPYGTFVNSLKGQAGRMAIKIGAPAPEIALPDPKGNIRKLSDLRGKLVLLDFWASWCGPCRRANPEVVRVYKKYKDKGFDVFSVSLDGDRGGSTNPNVMQRHRQRWINAIQQDGLIWPNHVSDLRSWHSEAAAKYGVTSIPMTFLISPDGKILEMGRPLRTNLEGLVKKHLKK